MKLCAVVSKTQPEVWLAITPSKTPGLFFLPTAGSLPSASVTPILQVERPRLRRSGLWTFTCQAHSGGFQPGRSPCAAHSLSHTALPSSQLMLTQELKAALISKMPFGSRKLQWSCPITVNIGLEPSRYQLARHATHTLPSLKGLYLAFSGRKVLKAACN